MSDDERADGRHVPHLVRWLAGAMPERFQIPPDEPRPAPTPGELAPEPGTPRSRAYVEAVIRDELAELAATAKGGRNHQLNDSTFRVAQFIPAGHVDEDDVREFWIKAGTSVGGQSLTEATKTVDSAIRGGKAKPRDVPPPRNPDTTTPDIHPSDFGLEPLPTPQTPPGGPPEGPRDGPPGGPPRDDFRRVATRPMGGCRSRRTSPRRRAGSPARTRSGRSVSPASTVISSCTRTASVGTVSTGPAGWSRTTGWSPAP